MHVNDPEPAARKTRTGRPGGRTPQARPDSGEALRQAVQRSLGSASASGPTEVQRSLVPEILRSAGRPLDDSVRSDMEARLGADFSTVRVHTGATAHRSAEEIGARAYTSGEHVVLGSRGSDQHTLAHELTHVIQQRQGPVAGSDHGGGLAISDPSDRFERAAEANATRVLRQSRPESDPRSEAPAPGGHRGGAGVQRVALSQARAIANASLQPSAEIGEEDFERTVLQPLDVIARKNGQDLPGYLNGLDDAAFLTLFTELQAGFRSENPRSAFGNLWARARTSKSDPLAELVPSREYEGFSVLPGTGLLVSIQGDGDEEAIRSFIRSYRSGALTWYRGLSISHFSWDALQKGVLASEGTQDVPTFTMGASRSRWLPGINDPEIPRMIAMSVQASENPGLYNLLTADSTWPVEHVLVPVGAVVRMKVTAKTPVAYLNSGEQVLRGPISSGVEIEEIWGYDSDTHAPRAVPGPFPPSFLPPRAPWGAHDAGLQGWRSAVEPFAMMFARP